MNIIMRFVIFWNFYKKYSDAKYTEAWEEFIKTQSCWI